MDFFLKTIDEVTANDITSVAKKLLSSPLTMASHGDGNFPLMINTLLYNSILHMTFYLIYPPFGSFKRTDL